MTPLPILAIDGGGVRGIIAAHILNEIETRTGQSTTTLFDLIVGNSIGGILALLLVAPGNGETAPPGAGRIEQLLLESLPKVLARPAWRRLPVIGTIADLLAPRYSPEGLQKLLKEMLGDTVMGDAVADIAVGAYDIQHGEPRIFRNIGPDCDILMRDVARATSAAPGLFPSAVIDSGPDGTREVLVDAALFAQNPAMMAHAEAYRRGIDGDRPLLVSLGAGRTPPEIDTDRAMNRGAARWINDILRITVDGANKLTDLNLQHIINGGAETQRYWRLDPKLPPEMESIDEAGKDHLLKIQQLAEQFVQSKTETIEGLCRGLTQEDNADRAQ